MKKLKLLFTGVALLGGVLGVQAQTDVTSTYLTNADFSGDRSEYTLPSGNTALSSDRRIYQPSGWSISVKNKNQYNYSVVKLEDKLQTTDFNSDPYKPTDGKYMVRFRNGNSDNEHITLSQTFTMKVSGVYTFSADLIREDGSKIDVTLSAAGGSVSNSSAGAWQTRSFDASITKDANVTVTLKFANKATSGDNKKRAGADNVKIEYKENVNGPTLAALIANAQHVNALLNDDDLAAEISTAYDVYSGIDNTPTYQATIDEAISDLRSAITTAYSNTAAWNHDDDLTAIISNAGFETTPIFDGTSLGENGTTNATATSGSTLLTNAVNVYQIAGWDLMTTETSDYARTFTMPYGQTLYVRSNSIAGGQAVTSPSNESSIKTSNNSILFIETSWCNNAVNGVQQTATLRAGMYKMTFDSYVSSSLSNASSRCGISYGNTTIYKWPESLDTWTNNEIVFTLAEETEVTFSLGYKKTANEGSGSSAFLFVDNVKLTFLDPLQQAQNEWQVVHDALADLDATLLPDAAETAITDALALSVPTTTVEKVNEAKAALQALIDSYDGIKAAYDKVNALITLATNEKDYSAGTKTTFADAISTATSDKEDCTDVDGLDDVYDALEGARQTYVTSGAEPADGYPFDITFKISNPGFEADGKETNSPTGWTIPNKGNTYGAKNKGSMTNAKGNYIFNNWQSWWADLNVQQTVSSLPNGRYTVSALMASYSGTSVNLQAGGGSTDQNMSGENTGIRVFVNGNVTEGSLTIIARAGRKNDGSLLKADDFTLQFKGLKPVLNDLIASASPLLTSNVGDGAFQIPSDAADALSDAIEDAQAVYDNDGAYGDDIQDAIDALNTAIETFQGTELNEPTSGVRYKLALADRGTLTFQTASTEGGYGMPFTDAADYKAQAFALTKVSGNNYNMSFTDLDGNTRYICTRAAYGEGGTGTAGIRTTTESEKALAVTIKATTTDGVYNLLNTARDNAKLGSNGGDFYTDDAYTSWSFVEASQVSIPVTIAAEVKLATRIFPFTPVLPSGVKAYSCEAVAGDVLTLVEVAEPAANTPYILYAENGYSGDALTGYGTATADTYTAGWLTGVYTAQEAPNESYVLQNHSDEVAFYQVDTSEAIPSVGAYRCYLKVPSPARVLYINFNEATVVETIKALTNGKNTIYNAAGTVVPSLQKGLNIIKTSDGTIRKVMVK